MSPENINGFESVGGGKKKVHDRWWSRALLIINCFYGTILIETEFEAKSHGLFKA